MSIAVSITDIPAAIAGQIGWCYLLTISDDVQARILAVCPDVGDDGALRFSASRGTAANLRARPAVTLVYPPATPEAMSLIVDGTTSLEGDVVTFVPTSAVMHRSAIATGGPNAGA